MCTFRHLDSVTIPGTGSLKVINIPKDCSCLFRSIACLNTQQLLKANRMTSGKIYDTHLESTECLLADHLRQQCVAFLEKTVPDSIGVEYPLFLEDKWGHSFESVSARMNSMRKHTTFAGHLECLAVAFLHDKPINVWVKVNPFEPECSLRQVVPCRAETGNQCSEQTLSMQSYNLLYTIDDRASDGHFDVLWSENDCYSFFTLSADSDTWTDFPSMNSQINAETFLNLINPEKWQMTPTIRTTEAMQVETTQEPGIELHECLAVHPISLSSKATAAAAEDTDYITGTSSNSGTATASVSEFIWNAPRQPRKSAYTTDEDKRRFRNCWFDMFAWLEYEETAELKVGTAFCFYCRQGKLRKLITASKSESAFTTVGFNKWKNAVQMFRKHEMTSSHQTSVAAVRAVLRNANVGAKMSQQSELVRNENTKMLTCIFNSLKYLCRQGLAIRGKTDDSSNFHQLMLTRAPDIDGMTHWLTKRTNWTSHGVQDEIIEIMAMSVMRKVASVIINQCFYGLMADETQDVSLTEQLVVCIRTVSTSLNVDEHVLGLHSLDKCDATTINAVITDILCRFNIDIGLCRAVCFDGASTFQGQQAGVSAKMQEQQPKILNTHCHMHCVNLAVQETVSSVPIMRNFLQFVIDLINFFRQSPKRCAIVRNVAESLQCKQSHIRPLCPTRFTVKYRALESISKQLVVLQEALATITEEYTENKIRAHASGFMKQLREFEFFFCLQVSLMLFELTDRLSTQLQSERLSAGESSRLVTFCIDELTRCRSQSVFEKIWQEANAASTKMDADKPCLPRQVGAPKRLQQGNCHKFDTPVDWYRKIYFEILDYAMEGLRRRIVAKNLNVLLATESLLQCGWSGTGVKREDLDIVSQHFTTDIDCFRLEQQLCCLENLRNEFPEADKNLPVSNVIGNIGRSKLSVKFFLHFHSFFLLTGMRCHIIPPYDDVAAISRILICVSRLAESHILCSKSIHSKKLRCTLQFALHFPVSSDCI